MNNRRNSSYIILLSLIFFYFFPFAEIISADTTRTEPTLQAKLETTVDLSAIKMGVSLKEAIEHVQNCFDPPLPIVVDWGALATVGIGPTDRASSRGWIRTTAGEALYAIFRSLCNDSVIWDVSVKNGHVQVQVTPYNFIETVYTLPDSLMKDASGNPLTPEQIHDWLRHELGSHLLVSQKDRLRSYFDRKLTVNGNKVTILQTPKEHYEIANIMSDLLPPDFRQIAIETRLVFITDSFFKDINVNIDQNETNDFNDLIIAAKSLPASVITGPANSERIRNTLNQDITTPMELPFVEAQAIDGNRGSFIARAAHAYRDATSITAPKVIVLNGHSANLTVLNDHAFTAEGQKKEIETGLHMAMTAIIDLNDDQQILLKGRILFSDIVTDEDIGIVLDNDKPIIQVCDIPVHTKIQNQQTAFWGSQKLSPMIIPVYRPLFPASLKSAPDFAVTSDHRLFVLIKASIVDHTESDLIARPSCQSD